MTTDVPKTLRRILIVLVLLLVGVLWIGYDGRLEVVESQRAGCERGKLDRTVNAKAFQAQADYLDLVLQAESVKEDVKRAARSNQEQQTNAASSLWERTGPNLDCVAAFPSPQFLPLP